MSRTRPALSPEVRSVVDCERAVPPLSAHERDRALSRARAALVAGVPKPVRGATRWTRWTHWAVAAALACVAGVAVGATAYQIRAHFGPTANHRPATPVVDVPVQLGPTLPTAPSATPASSVPLVAAVLPTGSTEPSLAPTGSVGPLTSAEAGTAGAELRLLRQARAAVARKDFAAALPFLAEHTRRYKNGRLAEEREALRVRALAGLGRADDARRAAAAFQLRFPHSVLLRPVMQMPGR